MHSLADFSAVRRRTHVGLNIRTGRKQLALNPCMSSVVGGRVLRRLQRGRVHPLEIHAELVGELRTPSRPKLSLMLPVNPMYGSSGPDAVL